MGKVKEISYQNELITDQRYLYDMCIAVCYTGFDNSAPNFIPLICHTPFILTAYLYVKSPDRSRKFIRVLMLIKNYLIKPH